MDKHVVSIAGEIGLIAGLIDGSGNNQVRQG